MIILIKDRMNIFNINKQQYRDFDRYTFYLIVLSIFFIILSFVNKYFLFLYPFFVIILTIINIEYGFSFILLTAGFNFSSVFNETIGVFSLNAIQVIGMLFFCVISLAKFKKIKINTVIKIFLLFISYIFLSLIFTSAQIEAIKMFGKFLVMFFLLILFKNYNIELSKVLNLIVFSGLISLFVFNPIYYILSGNNILITTNDRIRLEGGGFYSTAYVLFIGICFVASFILYILQKKIQYLFASVIFFLYSILTYTRAAWVALAVVFIIFLILKKEWIKIGIVAIIFGLLFFMVISKFFFLEGVQIDPRKDFLERFTQSRTYIWSSVYNKFIESPFFGLGFEYSTKYTDQELGITSNHSDPL